MSPISLRFIECYEQLRKEGKVRSARAFAQTLEYLPQSWSEVMNHRRDVTLELIRKAVEVYDINPVYLFTGQGDLFLDHNAHQPFRLVTVLSAERGDEKIVHVPVAAQAGYAAGLGQPTFIQDLPVFTLPDYRFKMGSHRCFDVSGDSMEPTLFEGDRVICQFIEPDFWFTSVKNNHVYVVVTLSDVVVKRVQNRLRETGELVLESDNNYYTPYILPGAEIREIWQVKVKLSPFLHTPPHRNDNIQEQLRQLEEAMKLQSRLMDNMNQKLGKG